MAPHQCNCGAPKHHTAKRCRRCYHSEGRLCAYPHAIRSRLDDEAMKEVQRVAAAEKMTIAEAVRCLVDWGLETYAD